jgi:FlaA1/EpsC-like NDP-sugar epimerase
MLDNIIEPSIDSLTELVTKRAHGLLDKDLERYKPQISETLKGARILVIGGAGSIGTATARELLKFRPKAFHVVDSNENGLAELVRDLRTTGALEGVHDFMTLPLDFGSALMRRFLSEAIPYSFVLNFAAIKHVRSESNNYSLLQMFNTNVLKPARLMNWLSRWHPQCTAFSVSTDKAANPVNLMGASKRIMEHISFSREIAPDFEGKATSARFANVAFSNGSLLASFLTRIQKRQPLACPSLVRRFFLSLREAGTICLLASTCCDHQHLLVPVLEADKDLRELSAIAVEIIRYLGFEPSIYHDEKEVPRVVQFESASKRYPILLTKPDTTGEKLFEEFLGPGEIAMDTGLELLRSVSYRPLPDGILSSFLEMLDRAINHQDIVVNKPELVDWIKRLIPEFSHAETGLHLDSRM